VAVLVGAGVLVVSSVGSVIASVAALPVAATPDARQLLRHIGHAGVPHMCHEAQVKHASGPGRTGDDAANTEHAPATTSDEHASRNEVRLEY
jgi:hypothetical protein